MDNEDEQKRARETAQENAQTNIYLSQIRYCFTNNYWDHFVHGNDFKLKNNRKCSSPSGW